MQVHFQTIELIYNESKFWLFFGGLLWTAFKTFNWFQTIKTNDLHHIQLGLDALHLEIKGQTQAIVTELKEAREEARADNRILVAALLKK